MSQVIRLTFIFGIHMMLFLELIKMISLCFCLLNNIMAKTVMNTHSTSEKYCLSNEVKKQNAVQERSLEGLIVA